MVEQQAGTWVVPNPQVPRTFGTLNIIFGILLLLFGVISVVMMVVGPMIQSAVMTQMNQQQAAKKADRADRIAALKKKEEAAKSKEEKKEIADERAAIETDVDLDMSGFMNDAMGMQSDIRIKIYTILETTAGLILNALLVASGIGLLRRAEWGRRLALGVAWLKILRWVAIIIFTMVVVVPITVEMQKKLFEQVEQAAKAKGGGGGTPFPMAGLAQATAIGSAIWVVLLGIFATTYPAISLWFLTRPATRAACFAASKPAAPPAGFEVGASP